MQKLSNFLQPYFLFYTFCLLWIILCTTSLFCYTDLVLLFFINHSHTLFFDNVNATLSAFGRGDVIAIIFIILLLIPANRTKKYLLHTASFGALIGAFVVALKFYFDRNRPLFDYETFLHKITWLDNSYYYSMPSGHTMGAFGFFTFVILYFKLENKIIQLLFFFLAAGCGFSRVYLAQHYVSDVLAGTLLGIGISTGLNYYLYKKNKK